MYVWKACLNELIDVGLLNIRGSDIQFNPVVISYVLVTLDSVNLYVNKEKVTDEVAAHLGKEVTIKPYDEIFKDVEALNNAKKVNLYTYIN
jgi:Xaa-Pro aminopeptidase